MSDAPVTRSRFAKITGWKSDNPELEPLLTTLKKYHSKDNFELVSKLGPPDLTAIDINLANLENIWPLFWSVFLAVSS